MNYNYQAKLGKLRELMDVISVNGGIWMGEGEPRRQGRQGDHEMYLINAIVLLCAAVSPWFTLLAFNFA